MTPQEDYRRTVRNMGRGIASGSRFGFCGGALSVVGIYAAFDGMFVLAAMAVATGVLVSFVPWSAFRVYALALEAETCKAERAK